jgi:hypothetical protein
MAVAVDAAGHPMAGGLDLVLRFRHTARERVDYAVPDADVRVEDIGGGRDVGVADHEIEVVHSRYASNTFRASSSSAGPTISTRRVPRVSTSRQDRRISSALGPDSAAKELFRPLEQVSGQAQVTDTVSVAAQYFFEWEECRYPEGGTYTGPVDFFFNGPSGNSSRRRSGSPCAEIPLSPVIAASGACPLSGRPRGRSRGTRRFG